MLLQHLWGGGYTICKWGLQEIKTLISLLQPNWIYIRIEINNAQDELNLQEGKCKVNGYFVWIF